MGELSEYLWRFISEQGTFGLVTWGLLAMIFKWWQIKYEDLSNTAKVLIAVDFPFTVVLLIYWTGVLMGYWPHTLEGFRDALEVAVWEIAGSQGIYGVTRTVEEKRKERKVKRRAGSMGAVSENNADDR